MATHSSTLAWKIPWMQEPGRLQSMGSLRVGYDWATSLSLFTFMHWRRKWQPTPVSLPGESQGHGEPGGLPSMGSHRVGHDWSDLATAVFPQYHPASSPSYDSNQTLLPHGKKPVCLVLQQLTQVYSGSYFHPHSRQALCVSRFLFQWIVVQTEFWLWTQKDQA